MAMTTSSNPSIFVDTSGWADAVLKNTPNHAAMEAFYKQCVASKRKMVTTNYILTELIALLTARPGISRDRLLQLIDRLKHMRQLELVYIDRDIDGQEPHAYRQGLAKWLAQRKFLISGLPSGSSSETGYKNDRTPP